MFTPLTLFFRKDFLYLSGILEPDSALVLYGKGRPDQAILFVPRRDPGRELWDGPRSGKDGAAALTGMERVHSTEELGVVLKSLNGGWGHLDVEMMINSRVRPYQSFWVTFTL